MGGLLTMSLKEKDRIVILDQLVHKTLTQKAAALRMGLSTRQVRRLQYQYLNEGAKGVISKKRGVPGNNRTPKTVTERALQLILAHYRDFGPTLAHEKLVEKHNFKIALSTIRNLMIEHSIWIPKRAKKPVIHQLRERRSCLGQLIQFDGSIHLWFENRGKRCTALVFIDDATSRLMLLRFVRVENLWDYFAAMREYLERYGRPQEVYCDRHSALRKRKPSLLWEKGMTQFQRVMATLNITLIHAYSPQAKGRVERANRTLQDRLVKEMRLRNISSLASANAFADEFMHDYNKRFAKIPKSSLDAHRSIEKDMDLDKIFCWHEERVVTKNLMVQYDNKFYVITPKDLYSRKLRGAKVQVLESCQGEVRLFYEGEELSYRLYEELPYEEDMAHSGEVKLAAADRWLREKKEYHPSPSHPWKRFRVAI